MSFLSFQNYSFRVVTLLLIIILYFSSTSFSQVSMYWSKDQWPLKEVSEKNYFGSATLGPTELAQRLNQVIMFYDANNKLISNFKKRLCTFYNAGPKAAYYNVKLKPELNSILPDNQTPLVRNLNRGDEFILEFITDDDRTFHFTIYLDEKENTYSAGVTVPTYGMKFTYDYQILKTPTGQTVVKMDTSLADNKKIIKGYSKVPNTAIKHIPGFKSSQNFIFEGDSIVELLKYNLKIHPVDTMKESWLADAVEPQELITKPAKMIWHKMIADPTSPNYSLKYGQSMAHLAMYLEINDTIYDVRSIRVTFYNHTGLNSTLYIDSRDFGELGKYLQKITDPLSVIIDRVVVKDNFSDRLIYDPQVFIFNFE